MVTVLSGKLVEVQDVVNDTVEKLDFRERVVKLSLAFNHLVVATSSQCYLFRLVMHCWCRVGVSLCVCSVKYRECDWG